ncbi:MAG: large conductance mechanosensitive channel protein MscL [Planctomycetes bacterium]|nr:large conductance mechanosensitive channel protein MscL [Planctomycetota bacterium]
MFKEFRAFFMRGNVIDLAIAVIIGAAFGAIVTSMVNDVLMPPIGALSGGLDFKDHFIVLNFDKASQYAQSAGHRVGSLAEARASGVPVIAYGAFINSLINFLIIAFCIFLVIKALATFQKPIPAPVDTKACPRCLSTVPFKASKCRECTADI